MKLKVEKRKTVRARPVTEQVWTKILENESLETARRVFLAVTTALRPEPLHYLEEDEVRKAKKSLLFDPSHSKKRSDIKAKVPCVCGQVVYGAFPETGAKLCIPRKMKEYARLAGDWKMSAQTLRRYKLKQYSTRRTFAQSCSQFLEENGLKFKSPLGR